MEEYINFVYYIFMFIVGTLFGSFFTLAIYRIPRNQDIVKTRSYCPNCKHKLGFFDCFPILSYISTLGRCRYCKKPISIRYPLIEFASGFTFLIIYLLFGFKWQSLVLIISYIFLFLIIGADIMKKQMTEEEIVQVKNIKKKAGLINSDVLVAIIIFIAFFISTIFVRKNYNATLVGYARKSNALNLCINKINEKKAESIYTMISTQGEEIIGEIKYSYNVEVLPYEKGVGVIVNNAKVIVSTVTYQSNGKENTLSLKSIKVENSI